jgi:C4-type Zn-finger protein
MKCPVCGGKLIIHTDGQYSPFGKVITILKPIKAWVFQCVKCKSQVYVPLSRVDKSGRVK